jgi:hypothetical protein
VESLSAFPHFRTLFNIALCEEKLGNVRGAIDMYQRYVDWSAEVPNRDAIRAKLAELKAQLPPEPAPPTPPAGDEALPPPVPPPPVSAPAPEPGPDLRVPGWITVGTGAAGVVVGAVFLGMAQKKKKEMEAIQGEPYDPKGDEAILEDGRLYQKVGWIVGGFGVLAAAVGAVLLVASDDGSAESGGAPDGKKDVALVPIVGPGGVAAVAEWRF